MAFGLNSLIAERRIDPRGSWSNLRRAYCGDTENLVSLLRDMRTRFGSSYGISIAIPASYWYLRNFDVQGMTRYVDWLNVMSYVRHSTQIAILRMADS